MQHSLKLDKKKTWTAPKGAKVDGASIPQLFWTPIGGPFEGKYRYASVIHDTECDATIESLWNYLDAIDPVPGAQLRLVK